MTGRKTEPRKELGRLADALAQDIMETSSDDILEEAAGDFENVDAVVRHAEELIEQAIVEVGKLRMQSAKAAVGDHQRRGRLNIIDLPIEKKREIVRQFGAQRPPSVEQATQAARKEDELTEKDLDAMLEALIQLGAIDDQGESR